MSQELRINFRSLKDVVVAESADTPIVIKCVTPSVTPGTQSTSGPLKQEARVSTYVRVDSLPRELQEKVRSAIESLQWG